MQNLKDTRIIAKLFCKLALILLNEILMKKCRIQKSNTKLFAIPILILQLIFVIFQITVLVEDLQDFGSINLIYFRKLFFIFISLFIKIISKKKLHYEAFIFTNYKNSALGHKNKK